MGGGEEGCEEAAGVGGFTGGDYFWGSLCDDGAAILSAFGAEVEDPVGGFDDVEVVFDYDEGISGVAEAAEDAEEAVDVGEMEACGGLIEEVDGTAGILTGEFGAEFHSLGLAAGEGCGGLSEAEVPEADFVHCFEFTGDLGDLGEEIEGFGDGQVEDVGDIFSFPADFEGFLVIAAAVAQFTRDVDVGEEGHFDFPDAVALTGFAAAALDIEAEAAWGVAAQLSGWEGSEEGTDGGKGVGIGCGVGAWGSADGGLIDDDGVIDAGEAADTAVGSWG